MDATPPLYQLLFPASTSFAEADYLAFLAQRVPQDIAEQLKDDSYPELGPSETVDIHDLVRPLSAHVLPSNELWEMAGILAYTVMCYSNEIEEESDRHDPYKLLYAVSLYLHCFVRGKGPGGGAYMASLGILTSVSMRLDLQTRLQVCRFLGSLVTMIYGEAVGPASVTSALSFEPAPISSVLIALSLIVGSIASDLSATAEHTMNSEGFSLAWATEEAHKGTSTYRGISILRRFASEMYGTSGKVRQIADRFLHVTEKGDEKKDIG